jgi:hypothetical protein
MTKSKQWTAFFLILGSAAFTLQAHAADKTSANHPPGPCKQIAMACENAGFIKGDWKKGDGLWRDCVDPIVQGQTNVLGATKSLPTVDSKLISECKAKHPKFGAGKVGSAK